MRRAGGRSASSAEIAATLADIHDTDHAGRSDRADPARRSRSSIASSSARSAAAAVHRLPAGARPPADRGHSRRRQDHAGARARRSLGLSYQRIQFTSDLLPADIIGVSVFERETSTFQFHNGPVFAQLVLADEINRATPKAQSALLEAMEEHQVTADGQTYPLAAPFFVIATQNPVYQIGTYPAAGIAARPLPDAHRARLSRRGARTPAAARARTGAICSRRCAPTLSPQQLLLMQTMVPQSARAPTRCSTTCRRSCATRASRRSSNAGLSPRAAIALLRAAQSVGADRRPSGRAPRRRAGRAAARSSAIGSSRATTDADAPRRSGASSC